MLVFDKNHEEAVRKAIKSGREVAEPLGLFGTGLMRKSLVLRHAPGVIRRHDLRGIRLSDCRWFEKEAGVPLLFMR